MVYCDHCWKNVSGVRVDDGPLCCSECGKVLEDYHFTEEPTFVKNTSGQSRLSGHYVRTVQTYDDLKYLSYNLGVNDDSMANQALKFYRIALERNFTRGRKSEQVQAACLYIAFRHNDKPYLLIDFSICLKTNVYVLGAVFLQLCKVLSLEEHPIVQKPIDPSLFIYKYTNKLLKKRNVLVSETALNIIASMKRDWMQTGRKPSGLCGAALYISALAHGEKCSKSDILRIVHICDATLTKRLVEFENTESASLTVEELNTMVKEHEKNQIKIPDDELNKRTLKDLLCEHKDTAVPYFALGLCETCYKDFDKLSGGLGGGLDPPAFQRAESERITKSYSNANRSYDSGKASNGACESQIKESHDSGPESIRANVHVTIKDGEHDESHEDDMNTENHDESESLSDIDVQEIDSCLLNAEETQFRTIIWENMNKDYLEEQAAKQAAVAKSTKEIKPRRAQEAKNLGPAQSPLEACHRTLEKKRVRVNEDALKRLFDKHDAAENPKKVRFELPFVDFESKLEDKIKDDEEGSMDEFEGDDMNGGYENTLYQENAYETYDYDYDYDYEHDGYSYDR
ncbi:Transcription factor IIIB 70 kDa subunit [Spatholobus suberectus]|nr:Transcription factor IIIB 70 kDa subunit [Spatholobus suberectus]